VAARPAATATRADDADLQQHRSIEDPKPAGLSLVSAHANPAMAPSRPGV
jgi:hypothetical protein